jgi:hypothetical protein
MNPLDNDSMTLSEGNLQGISPANAHNGVGCTLGVTGGKWYWEVRSAGTGTNIFFGMAKSTFQFISQYTIDAYFFSDIWGVATDGQKFGNGSGESSYGSTLSEGDILQLAFDLDNGKFYAGKNGTYYASGDPAAGSNPAFTDVPTDESMQPFYGSSTTGVSHTLNFGQDSTFAGATTAGGNTDANGIGDFAYAPPSGFLSLCSANLPTSTIIDGSEHFNTVLYTGNGSTQSITGVGFQPDWTWIKMRSGADNNILQDAVRGVGKGLFSDLTNAENASMGGMTSFDSDGFTFDGSVTSLNGSGDSFVAWNWKAGGTAVSNTDGSVTSQVSANTDAGFSIVSYTGTGANATVGHGLSSAPEMLIIKERNATSQWVVGHHNLAASDPFHKGLYLDDTRAVYDDASNFNDTAPTSTVFSVGTGGYVNDSSNTYICYAFHSVDGFSKVGSYTGNGSTDGPFVYTGFRPAWVMFKNTNNSSGWSIIDSTRNPFNEAENYLYPSASDAEYGGAGNDGYDFVSNGFKVSNTYTGQNGSGNTIIYLAFAESPFKYANAR